MKALLTQTLYADRVSNVPQNFIREILKVASNPSIISLAGGLPNPDFFPTCELEASAVKVFGQNGRQALQYHVTEGYYPLREFIAERYRSRCKLDITPEQILITNGSQQALDLIGKLFVNPGDNVLLERPTYLGALQCLSQYHPVFHEVTLDDDGINISELEQQLNTRSVKLFYGIPDFQNPTGIRYSLEKRQIASGLFRQHDTLVIEDDPYGEILFDTNPLPHLYSFIPEQTILLGSFSKIVSPGLRLGWMVAGKEIIRKATIMKQASDLHSGNLTQFIVHQFLVDYDLDKHIQKIRSAYALQRDVMVDGLKSHFPITIKYTKPEGGMFCWIKLSESQTAQDLLDEAIKHNIVFVPGETFYACNPDRHTLRMNFSNVEPAKMKTALKILGGLTR